MSSVNLWVILSWILFICAAIYLASLFTVVALLKRDYSDYWQRIGSPNLFDPNSIAAVFPKIILGRDLPEDAATRHRITFWALRVSIVISVIIFVLLMSMMLQGKAPK